MQAADRWKHELETTIRRLGSSEPRRQAEALRDWVSSSFRGLPADLIAALFEDFPARLAEDREAALAWLGAVGSMLYMDYDGTPLAPADWAELREAFSDAGGDLDLELLTYVMGLVVERGHL